MIIYKGPSMVDGQPIVIIATGIKRPSKNRKTGAMVQVWIFADNGMTPMNSSKSGADVSVCGSCAKRALIRKMAKLQDIAVEPECYVDLSKAPMKIMKAYLAGAYPDISGNYAAIAAYFARRIVRGGAYGDPMAGPAKLWRAVYRFSAGRTAYSHMWKDYRTRGFAAFGMASVDSPEEREQAHALGWRTFRVKKASDPVLPGELVCPASKEAGEKITCKVCQFCNGWSPLGRTNRATRDVVINSH